MHTSADTSTADMTDTTEDRATPARLRHLPSRLLTQVAMHADRLANQGLARADARKWHYAVLAALQEFGPASQAALSRRTPLILARSPRECVAGGHGAHGSPAPSAVLPFSVGARAR